MMLGRCAGAVLRSRGARPLSFALRAYGSITYSGGQATEGQGGFYGSGGARAKKEAVEWNSKAVAQLEDIKSLHAVMADVSALESEIKTFNDPLNETVIGLKQRIKQMMTAKATVALIDRLEMGGEPVWGLSRAERELVREAQQKLATC